MNRFAWIVLAALAVTLAVGCSGGDKGKTDAAKGGSTVAVVDLAQVVKDLGKDNELQGLIDRAKDALKSQGTVAAEPGNTKMTNLQTKIQARVKKIAETQPAALGNQVILSQDPEWVSIYKEMVATQDELKVVEGKYNQALQTYVQDLFRSWQDTLQPAMITVAKEKGVLMILPKNPQPVGNAGAVQVVAWSAPEVDITGDLVQYLKKNPPKPFTPPPSKFDIPK